MSLIKFDKLVAATKLGEDHFLKQTKIVYVVTEFNVNFVSIIR